VGELEACLEDLNGALAAASNDELCNDPLPIPASCDPVFNDPDCQ
jgi:hypothetical protein